MDTVKRDLLLHVEGLHKSFGDHVVLAGVELGVLRGSVFSVLGPSGPGNRCSSNAWRISCSRTLDGSALTGGLSD